MSVFDIIDDASSQIQLLINDQFVKMNAGDCELDSRSGTVFVSQDCIVIHKSNRRTLDYYGGFEYVDEDCVTVVDEWVVYDVESERVQRAIEAAVENGRNVT